MLEHEQALVVFIMVIASTFITRFLPFILFARRHNSRYVAYLGRVLPYASIGLLVVYCLRNVNLTARPYALPELAALSCIVLLHYWRDNILLSIATGTAVYMFMIQYVMV